MKSNIIKDLIKEVNKRELASERMRLLYVALTRARERLFVIVSENVKDGVTEQEKKALWEGQLLGGKMLPSEALSAKGFFSWICPAAYISKRTWRVEFHTPHSVREEAPEQEEETYEESEELKRAVYEILDYSYPYPESSGVPSRTSVTQLKEMEIERGDIY